MGSRYDALARISHQAFAAAAVLALLASPGRDADGAGLTISRVQGRSLEFPSDVAVDRKGVAFLLDSGARTISLFSPRGDFIREIAGKGAWKDPTAVAVGPDGAILLADGDSGRVLELELSGKIRREYAVGKNARVTGVGAFGDAVFCVDNRNGTVVVFKRGGGRTSSWGKKGDLPGEFNAPFRLAVDVAGRVFVTDVMNARVQWFSAFGQHLGTLKRFGAAEGKMFRPTGLAVDSRGRILVGDSYTGLVQIFEEDGRFVRSLQSGGRPHVFGDPVGVAEGPEGIWVADQRESRAVLFDK